MNTQVITIHVIDVMPYLLQFKKKDTIGIEGPLCISGTLSPPFFPQGNYRTEFTPYHSHERFYTSATHLCSHKQYSCTAVKTWYQYVFSSYNLPFQLNMFWRCIHVGSCSSNLSLLKYNIPLSKYTTTCSSVLLMVDFCGVCKSFAFVMLQVTFLQ